MAAKRTVIPLKKKQAAVAAYKGGMSATDVIAKYKISSLSMLHNWSNGRGLGNFGQRSAKPATKKIGTLKIKRRANGHDKEAAPLPPPLVPPPDAVPLSVKFETNKTDAEFSELHIEGTVPTKLALQIVMMMQPRKAHGHE